MGLMDDAVNPAFRNRLACSEGGLFPHTTRCRFTRINLDCLAGIKNFLTYSDASLFIGGGYNSWVSPLTNCIEGEYAVQSSNLNSEGQPVLH